VGAAGEPLRRLERYGATASPLLPSDQADGDDTYKYLMSGNMVAEALDRLVGGLKVAPDDVDNAGGGSNQPKAVLEKYRNSSGDKLLTNLKPFDDTFIVAEE